MIQKFEFTTAAMAAALEETGVTYEELEDIEAEFEDVETEISESCCTVRATRAAATQWSQSANHDTSQSASRCN
jgi:hypothetical protein